MIAFVDASVIVSIVGNEPGWEILADALDDIETRFWSPVARWESIAALRVRLRTTPAYAQAIVDDFASDNQLKLVPIGAVEGDLAVDAYARFGKGTGHPAQLNMGDCFAYACARANGATLLYKGNDFVHTDMG